MLVNSSEVLKTDTPWSWRSFAKGRKRWLQLLGLLTTVLLIAACGSLFLQFYWGRHFFLLRVSSPISPLQEDHPSSFAIPARNSAHEGSNESVALRRNSGPSSVEELEHSLSTSKRFFRAATAAAAEGGVVLQWGEATIRMLRGAGVGEIFFLFYNPSDTPLAPTNVKQEEATGKLSEEQQADPLQVFRQLASEDRDEQHAHQLPFVSVPREEMHRLSFFLPEFAERMLPLAMVVRLDSGWMKFQAPPKAPFSLPAMKAFLSSYRKGKVAPLLRTEPLPPSIAGAEAVKPVVASNFSRVILEQSKYDALVLLYANWCGHCRRFQKLMEALAERFSRISSIAFFKMDVSRNDVPLPGLRVERVPHVIFITRDPDKASPPAASSSSPEIAAAARTAAAAARETSNPTASSWHFGTGPSRKKLLTFSHSEPDILTYGEAFLLQHASCRFIDLDRGKECNSAEGKDSEDL